MFYPTTLYPLLASHPPSFAATLTRLTVCSVRSRQSKLPKNNHPDPLQLKFIMLNNHRNSSFKSLPRSADAWGSVNTVALEQIQEATHMLTPLTPLTTLTSAPPTPLAYPTPPASATLMTPLASLTPLTPLSSLSELSELADPSQQPTLRPVSVGVQCQTPHAGQHKSGVTLVAGFDPLQPQNIRFEPPRDKEKNVSWTENQRALAQNAINPTTSGKTSFTYSDFC